MLVIIGMINVILIFGITLLVGNKFGLAVSASIVSAVCIGVSKFVYANKENLKTVLKCVTIYKNKEIRLSISYLYRIKVDDKYLLVKGNRIADQFQPVGGVYKYYSDSNSLFDKLKIRQDKGFAVDELNQNDLRVMVPGRNVTKFIDWFKKGIGREVCPCREFYEELIKTGILSSNKFSCIRNKFIRRYWGDIKYVRQFECYEIQISDIYELVTDGEQSEELRNLLSDKGNQDYIWANEEQIKRLGVSGKQKSSTTKIAPTAERVL